ncbi:MAG: XisI protein [Pleurocapsa sp. CRU_1_2]|nr:XisI protein [Pseudanabaena sp. SU_2_4]NJO96208.1 XisI protein [Pleurocapsa sp. CRU_1_2]
MLVTLLPITNYQILTTHASFEQSKPDPEIECQLIFDTEHDHYQLLDIGWEKLKRVYNCFIHLDIKDGKIWIQRNMNETDLWIN